MYVNQNGKNVLILLGYIMILKSVHNYFKYMHVERQSTISEWSQKKSICPTTQSKIYK